MMKSSITELQGMMGGEMSQSMQQLRQSAASGEGQMRATLDLAKEMGSGISRQQEARKARGAMLFQEYKKKMGMVQPEAAATAQPAPAQPERQKIAEKGRMTKECLMTNFQKIQNGARSHEGEYGS